MVEYKKSNPPKRSYYENMYATFGPWFTFLNLPVGFHEVRFKTKICKIHVFYELHIGYAWRTVKDLGAV